MLSPTRCVDDADLTMAIYMEASQYLTEELQQVWMAQVGEHGDLSSEAANHCQNIAQQQFDYNRSALTAADEHLQVALTYMYTLRNMLSTPALG